MGLLVNPRIGNLDLLWLQCSVFLLSQEGWLAVVHLLDVGSVTISIEHLIRHVSRCLSLSLVRVGGLPDRELLHWSPTQFQNISIRVSYIISKFEKVFYINQWFILNRRNLKFERQE